MSKEVDLRMQLQKLSLDKYILLKEKLATVWSDKVYKKLGPVQIEPELKR
jgi:hypothetical protein